MPGKRAGGGEVERFETGMEELLALADESGPPDVPTDLGNFPAEGESPRVRGQAPPARKREPERLQTAEEEMLEREVRGEPVGKRSERAERPAPPDDPDDEPETDDEPEADDEPTAEEAEGEDEAEPRAARETAYGRELRELREARERDALELAELRGRVSAYVPGQQPAAAPQAEVLEPITLDNALPWQIGDDVIDALGLRPADREHARKLLTAMFQTAHYHTAQQLARHYQAAEAQRPRAETIIANREALRAAHDETTKAFYRAHPYLNQERHGDLIETVSSRVKQRLDAAGTRYDGRMWMDETAREAARMLGIRRTTTRGRASATAELERGGNVRTLRPAFTETSVAGHGRQQGRKPVSGVQKEILDLVRFG